MKFYFGGDSGTVGQDLARPNIDSFPALVSQHYGAEYHNDAVSGASNQRIWEQCILNSDAYDHYFILWTAIDRFKLHLPNTLTEVHFNLRFDQHAQLKKFRAYQEFGELYYGQWYSPLYAFKQFLFQILSLQKYLSSKNKPYTMLMTTNNAWARFTAPWPEFCDQISSMVPINKAINLDQHYSDIQKLLSEIDFDQFVDRGNYVLVTELVEKKYPVGPTQHPLEEAHRAFANKIIEYRGNIYESK